MKFLNGEYYNEVKDHRYKIHPTENNNLRKRDPRQSLRTQYQVQNETHKRKNQKVVENNEKLEGKNYPKNEKQTIIQQQPNCLSCKRNLWLEIEKGYCCKNYENIINKEKHQIDRKVRRQECYFSTRLPYDNRRVRDIYYSVVDTIYD